MNSDGTRIFDGDHLRAVLWGEGADTLVVTFDFRTPGKVDFAPQVRSTSFAKRGFAQLSIKSKVNDWFINDDTPELEQVLATLAPQFKMVNLLGFSMGGYGAFRFAKTLRANAVIAVSPQVSIHPDVVPFDRRYRAESGGFSRALGDLDARAMPELRGVILADPFKRLDLRHANLLQRHFPQVHIARLAAGGHPATGVLRPAQKAWVVHRAAGLADPDPKQIIKAHRNARRSVSPYWTGLGQANVHRRPELAAHALAMAETLG